MRAYLDCDYVAAMSDQKLLDFIYRQQYYERFLRVDRASVCCPQLAEIAHSCTPNASAYFREDGFVYVVATKSIECDADVRICYENWNALASSKGQPDTLLFRFYMRCKCKRCADDLKIDSATRPNRDDYLRSVRCPAAIRAGVGLQGCNAPCPMTQESCPAAEHCANGHPLVFSDADEMLRYKLALAWYECRCAR